MSFSMFFQKNYTSQAIVEHENSDGTFTVRFDKDGYEYHYPLTAWRVPKARHFIEELEEGAEKMWVLTGIELQ